MATADENIELRRCANPYKVKINETKDNYESFIRNLRYILNRVTPENFKKLTVELLNLPINSRRDLTSAVDVIFEKSLVDHVYASVYAKLCKILSETKVSINFPTEADKCIGFSTILIKKCEKEFEKGIGTSLEMNQSELEDDYQERLYKSKVEYIGNLILIGELFKQGIIDEHFIFKCIDRLFDKEPLAQNLEFICTLISCIGEELDKLNAIKLNAHFARLKMLMQENQIHPARIRYMIMNLIDLKERDWKVRRNLNVKNPRRLDEIREEYKREQEKIVERLNLYTFESSTIDPSSTTRKCHCMEELSFNYAKHVFEECIEDRNFQHALADIEKLRQIENCEFIKDLLVIALNKDSNSRHLIGNLFYESLKQAKLNVTCFKNGLKKFLELADDIKVDMPNLPHMIAEIMCEWFVGDANVSLDFLPESFESIIDNKFTLKIISKTLKMSADKSSVDNVLKILNASNIVVKNFFSYFKRDEDVNNYLKDNQLQWIQI